MAYRTILVHLGDANVAQATLKAAIHQATIHDAHLIGIHVVPSIRIYASVEAYIPTEIIEVQRLENQKKAEALGEMFEAEIQKAGVSGEWRVSDIQGRSPASEIVSHGRRADLIITSQANPDDSFQGSSSWSEQIMIEAGRPVLFIPYIGNKRPIGKKVLVAWNGSRESARAVFDALPILKRAESVEVLWANPPANSDGEMSIMGSEIATTLARHDVKVTADHGINHDISIGDELLARASDHGSDLIVMGGYGHSRFREMILGGVTRLIMQSMTVPVLMSH